MADGRCRSAGPVPVDQRRKRAGEHPRIDARDPRGTNRKSALLEVYKLKFRLRSHEYTYMNTPHEYTYMSHAHTTGHDSIA